MASPKDKELKMQRMLDAWKSLAPGKSFGGMTLAQFQAVAQPAIDARQQITDLEDQLTKAISVRDAFEGFDEGAGADLESRRERI